MSTIIVKNTNTNVYFKLNLNDLSYTGGKPLKVLKEDYNVYPYKSKTPNDFTGNYLVIEGTNIRLYDYLQTHYPELFI